MNIQKIFNVLVSVSLSTYIIGCSNSLALSKSSKNAEDNPNLQLSLHDSYSNLGKTDGKTFVLNPKLSIIKIYAFRGGRAPALGHNHVLSSPDFTGFVYLPNKGTLDARFDLEFRLSQLGFDNPEDSIKPGEEFASELSIDGIKRTRDHMLGDDNLQADRFPFVRIHSVHVAGELPKLAVEVQVELHGQQHNMLIPLNAEVLPSRITASGSFVLRQSDFGIQPYSALGGFLAVQNELVIEFTLVGS